MNIQSFTRAGRWTAESGALRGRRCPHGAVCACELGRPGRWALERGQIGL